MIECSEMDIQSPLCFAALQQNEELYQPKNHLDGQQFLEVPSSGVRVKAVVCELPAFNQRVSNSVFKVTLIIE